MLSIKEFKTLILIHASDVDYEIHENERKFILGKYGHDSFEKMYSYYIHLRKESFDFIWNNFDIYFPKDEQKLMMKQEVFSLFLSDYCYNDFEKAFMQLFRLKTTMQE